MNKRPDRSPHAWRDPADPRLRTRLWVDGVLVHQVWLDTSNPDFRRLADAANDRHVARAAQAERDGLPWMIESFDPTQPPDRGYQRIGTDPATG